MYEFIVKPIKKIKYFLLTQPNRGITYIIPHPSHDGNGIFNSYIGKYRLVKESQNTKGIQINTEKMNKTRKERSFASLKALNPRKWPFSILPTDFTDTM